MASVSMQHLTVRGAFTLFNSTSKRICCTVLEVQNLHLYFLTGRSHSSQAILKQLSNLLEFDLLRCFKRDLGYQAFSMICKQHESF